MLRLHRYVLVLKCITYATLIFFQHLKFTDVPPAPVLVCKLLLFAFLLFSVDAKKRILLGTVLDADTHICFLTGSWVTMYPSFPDLSRSCHVTLFRKKTNSISFDYQW